MSEFRSWGNYPPIDQSGTWLANRKAEFPADQPVLPYGNGRSYGDSCLLAQGRVLATRRLDHFIHFDRDAGILRCEAGVLLADILALTVPAGWFLPVTPGTSYVTVGGAIANDVHGKNHHLRGTFGQHVTCFELLRSDNSRRVCSAQSETELFNATIGGLGLTGLVTWAELQLMPVTGNAMVVENLRFRSLDEFFDLTAESDQGYEYTVSWVDCAATGSRLGRGIFSRGNHSAGSQAPPARRPAMPITPPVSLINRLTVNVFNQLYYRRQWSDSKRSAEHYQSFLYPLDSLKDWNKIYGRRGFLQYQFVVPTAVGPEAIKQILEVVSRSGLASTLAVLKVCGEPASPGLLSFPMPGVSLAMDFPNRGQETFELFARLDEIIAAAGGRLYPAKDAHMSAQHFQQYYPQWQTLERHRDAAITSSFWQRVTHS